MYFVLLTVAFAIIAGVVVVAMGRGGELATIRRDVPPLRARLRSPSDVLTLRLPVGPLGYRVRATEDALDVIARLLADRDAEIADLRDEVARLGALHAGDVAAAGDEPDQAARPGSGTAAAEP